MLINIFNLHLLVLTFMGFAIWEPIKQELSGEASADQLMCIPWCEIVHSENFWALLRRAVLNAQVNAVIMCLQDFLLRMTSYFTSKSPT